MDHRSAPDAGSRKDPDGAPRAFGGAEAVFGKNPGVHIVAGHRRAAKGVLQFFGDGHIHPAQIGSFEDDSFLRIHRPRASHPDPGQVRRGQTGCQQSLLNGLDDAGDACFLAPVSLRFSLCGGNFGELVIENLRQHLGAAEVETDPVFGFFTHESCVRLRAFSRAQQSAARISSSVGWSVVG